MRLKAPQLSIIERIRQHPEFFASLLDIELTNYQIEIANAVRDNTLVSVKSSHAVGKSFLAAFLSCWWLTSYNESVVVVTAPTERQAKTIVASEAGALAYKLINRGLWPAKTAVNKLALELSPRHFMVAYASGKNMERGQGLHSKYVLIICDEASGIPIEVYNALDGIEASGHTRTVMIGNPTSTQPDNRFYNNFKRGQGKRFTISVFDTPNFKANGIDSVEKLKEFDTSKAIITHPYLVNPTWAKEKIKTWGGADNPMFAAKVLAEFWQGGDVNALIPLWAIEEAVERKPPNSSSWLSIIGADIARYGDDETIFSFNRLIRQNTGNFMALDYQKSRRKQSLMETTGQINAELDESVDLAVIDDSGVGGGVTDRLEESLTKRSVGINVAWAPNFGKKKFTNLRAQLYWRLRESFLAGTISLPKSPESDELAAELSGIRFKYLSSGKIAIEPKEAYKKRTGKSPDRADSLMLTMFRMRGRGELLEQQNTNVVLPKEGGDKPEWSRYRKRDLGHRTDLTSANWY